VYFEGEHDLFVLGMDCFTYIIHKKLFVLDIELKLCHCLLEGRVLQYGIISPCKFVVWWASREKKTVLRISAIFNLVSSYRPS